MGGRSGPGGSVLNKSTAYHWGKLYGLLQSRNKINMELVALAVANPATHLLESLKLALPLFLEPELNTMAMLIQHVEPEQAQLDTLEQGQFWRGFHEQQAEGQARPKGSPKGALRVDWSRVDWRKTNSELALEKGVRYQTVSQARKRHAPETCKG